MKVPENWRNGPFRLQFTLNNRTPIRTLLNQYNRATEKEKKTWSVALVIFLQQSLANSAQR